MLVLLLAFDNGNRASSLVISVCHHCKHAFWTPIVCLSAPYMKRHYLKSWSWSLEVLQNRKKAYGLSPPLLLYGEIRCMVETGQGWLRIARGWWWVSVQFLTPVGFNPRIFLLLVLNVWVELEPTIFSGSLFHWLHALSVRKDLLTRLFSLNFPSCSKCTVPVLEVLRRTETQRPSQSRNMFDILRLLYRSKCCP